MRPPSLPLVALFIISLGPAALGQQVPSITPDIEEGHKPYGDFYGSDVDQVSLSSGKLELNIPLVSYPQRGKLKLAFGLRWQNPIAVAKFFCPLGTNCTYTGSFPTSTPDLVFTNSLFWGGGNKGAAPNGHGNYAEVTAPDGSTRQMVWTGTAFETIDGTEMLVDQSNALKDQNGLRFSSGGTSHTVEDGNGNYITPNPSSGEPTGYVDTLGRTVPLPPCNIATNTIPYGSCYPANSTTDYSHCSGSVQPNAAYTWAVPAPGGATETFKFCYAPFSYSFVISVDSHSFTMSGNAAMLESIVLPNNSTWTFDYGPTYPTVQQITFPTGGTISYTWNLFIAPSYKSTTNPRNGTVNDQQSWFFVLASRSVNANDGSGSHTWSYSGGPFAGSTTGGDLPPSSAHGIIRHSNHLRALLLPPAVGRIAARREP